LQGLGDVPPFVGRLRPIDRLTGLGGQASANSPSSTTKFPDATKAQTYCSDHLLAHPDRHRRRPISGPAWQPDQRGIALVPVDQVT
jgi:hypothetical protein